MDLRYSFQSTRAVALLVRSTIANKVPTADMARIWDSALRLLPKIPRPVALAREANGTGVEAVAVRAAFVNAPRRVLAT